MELEHIYDNQDLRVGDIVRFHTPYHDEEPNSIFIVLWSYYDPKGKSSRAQVVKFDSALKPYPSIRKWFIRDLERVPEVSPALMQEIRVFMKNRLGNTIIKTLVT